jgi:hypothetical protein
MLLRSGRTKVVPEKTANVKTEEDLMVDAIAAQYLVKRTEKEQLKRLVREASWFVSLIVVGYTCGLFYKMFSSVSKVV